MPVKFLLFIFQTLLECYNFFFFEEAIPLSGTKYSGHSPLPYSMFINVVGGGNAAQELNLMTRTMIPPSLTSFLWSSHIRARSRFSIFTSVSL